MKVGLYNAKKLENKPDLEKIVKHARTTKFRKLFIRHKKFICFYVRYVTKQVNHNNTKREIVV